MPAKPLALITGASGGLGEQFAWLCAKDKYDLVLVARQEDKLKELALSLEKAHGAHTQVIAADLSTESGIKRVADAAQVLPLTLLINNAGFGAYGEFAKTDFTREREMIDVNILALTSLTKAALPGMITRGEGRVLNVASLAGFMAGPYMSVYYASKAYVLSFSEAIRQELAGTGVSVTCLCPGPTRTHFAVAANVQKSPLFQRSLMDADVVARVGYNACLHGKPFVVPGIQGKIGAFATRLVPRSFSAWVAKNTNKAPKS